MRPRTRATPSPPPRWRSREAARAHRWSTRGMRRTHAPLPPHATGAPRRFDRACGPSRYSTAAPESVLTSIMTFRLGGGGVTRRARRRRRLARARGGGDAWWHHACPHAGGRAQPAAAREQRGPSSPSTRRQVARHHVTHRARFRGLSPPLRQDVCLKGARDSLATSRDGTACALKKEMAEGATEDMETNATSNGSEEMETNAKAAKQKRYDRQLRLWGEHGQEAMEECSVCLLNASACGSETLKNLVLPGARAPLERASPVHEPMRQSSLCTRPSHCRHRLVHHRGRRQRDAGGPGQQLLRRR